MVLVAQLNVHVKLLQVLLQGLRDDVAASLALAQTLLGLHYRVHALHGRVLSRHIFLRGQHVFLFEVHSSLVLGLDDFLGMLGLREALRGHASLDSLLHVQTRHDVHL